MAHGPTVTVSQSEMLLANYSKDEVRKVIFAITGNKAPGPDGYGSYFYQEKWTIIGDEVAEAICSFLKTGQLLKEINSIVITLVPKTKCPNTLVMTCIRTPRFSLMINGSLHGYFEAKRGLRQGDPMSPLIFVLGMEYLTRIMQKVGQKSDFAYHNRCKELKLNHLMFADDVLLFCNGDYKSICYLLQGLKLFSQTSGLQPNASKSAIFSSGMSSNEVQRILEVSGLGRVRYRSIT
ncbi:uncharacterized protein LOC133814495 [Humulus lupulus]|uniref:uncharacterized protein LOC133814495 n=1 Tax=Humulus lupulus TaxID=3486 RepID=UPI002B4126ED|nr:uncharacterized protein LOC133814495 [Humulus lupulus]